MFKKKQLMLDMVDENGDFPISTASYEMCWLVLIIGVHKE